jgi:hypothetical protein
MCNHTTVAKALVVTACTLAIALLINGMGVDSTWAGSAPPPISSVAPSHAHTLYADSANLVSAACPSKSRLCRFPAKQRLAAGYPTGQACCNCTDKDYHECVRKSDCPNQTQSPGLPSQNAAAVQRCYDDCYTNAQHNCGCACNH